jgi:anti-sigma factor ChrR (cupin superfamily)
VSEQSGSVGCRHRELAVGWALHALEPAEESLVAAHLPDCPECSVLVAETEELGATLGMSIEQQDPSPELEQRVLALARSSEVAPVIPLAQPVRPGWKVASPGYRILAAAAAVLLVATSVALGVRVVQLDDERDQAMRQVAALSEVIKRAADPDSTRVPLVAADGHRMGMVLAGPDAVVVVPTDLPANRVTEETYVLWGLGDNEPTPLAGFDVPPDAPVLHTVRSGTSARKFTGYAVSREPGRAMPATPTEIVATGKVES